MQWEEEEDEENRKEKIYPTVPENKNINYGYPCGYIDQSFDLWNDNIELNNEIINYKIIKIKLYLSSKNYIIGINITYEKLVLNIGYGNWRVQPLAKIYLLTS